MLNGVQETPEDGWCGKICVKRLWSVLRVISGKNSGVRKIRFTEPFRIVCITMSSVIYIDDRNKQWAVATVVLYNKNMFELMK